MPQETLMEFLQWMWTWSLLKRSPGGSQVRMFSVNGYLSTYEMCARLHPHISLSVIFKFVLGAISFNPYLLACLLPCCFAHIFVFCVSVYSILLCGLKKVWSKISQLRKKRDGLINIFLFYFSPLVWLTSVCVGVGVFFQERISQITLTMALMKTRGRHIVKNRRGCEWDSRSLPLAQ